MPNGLIDYGKMGYKQLLVLLAERQENIKEKVDAQSVALKEHKEVYHVDLSKRIGKLEGFRMWFLGAVAVIGVVLTILLRVFA